MVALEEDADPTEVESWTVTEPLIVRGATYADERTVPTARIGRVELTYGSTSHRGAWGYPGGYLLEPATARPDVDPLWVAVGAAMRRRGTTRCRCWSRGVRSRPLRGGRDLRGDGT